MNYYCIYFMLFFFESQKKNHFEKTFFTSNVENGLLSRVYLYSVDCS